ncbi:MAG: NADH-quinone oxidoreductase subunit NuoE [Anaerolineae bacterium]|jgi:NADH-quinone oxidoreductase E subunit
MSQATRFRDPANQSMVLTALYIAQEQYGYLSQEALERVAERLELPISQVYSTASFYSLLRTQEKGKYHIQVCEGISCALCGGAEKLVDYLEEKLEIQPGEISPDGMFSLEVVQCLASCGTSPALRVNDELYDDLNFDKVDRLLDQLVEREEA